MNNEPFMPLKDTDLGNTALRLSEDRRLLLDFVRICSSGEIPGGGYSCSRKLIQQKAIQILEELEEND
jgi:hypothetical protein